MNLIAAVDRNWAIGKDNKLLFPIPADLRRFRAMTMGHPVLMGRKTLESLPGGKPLAGRRNLVLSRNPGFWVQGVQRLASPEEAAAVAPADTFVIGGAEIYRALLGYCDTAYITMIDGTFEADAWIPDLDRHPDWVADEVGEEGAYQGIRFYCITYRRVAGWL